ncbi:MAG: TonB family protein [Gammaproteobacteria bacterium]|nr:TonB family protein [Gammaproteobacteria bacterium]MYK47682.1 TonB family protein [Gammaproteobacteria bacterium]
MFERAAIKAALKFKYKPRIVDGEPVATAGVRNRIAFAISDAEEPSSETQEKRHKEAVGDIGLPIVKVAPVYPGHAIKEGIEGHVLLEFVVTETGAVRDAVVLEAQPSGVFEQAALKAVAKFKYKPRTVDGKAVATAGVRNRVAFEISDE